MGSRTKRKYGGGRENSLNFDGDAKQSRLAFEILAQNITDTGYSIQKNALPKGLGQMLWNRDAQDPTPEFQKAGIGRNGKFVLDALVRSDEISWIDGATKTGAAWIDWTAAMQAFLNERLFLGLFSFESHFARYGKGDFYRRHQDAFSGEDNRTLSLVVYLNQDWLVADAGELVLFIGDGARTALKVAPEFGTMVAFLSEDFPHEVLATNCDRHSIAGWFRVN